MRTRKGYFTCGLLLTIAGCIVLSLAYGQERAAQRSPQDPSVKQAVATVPSERRTPDLTKLSLLQQQIYLCAQRGGDWLCRVNGADGRFVYGYLPDLKTTLDTDHYLHQVAAAGALAQIAALQGEQRCAAVARQAVLTLLLDTAVDPNDPRVRHCSLPGLVVNHLGAAAHLVLAINELPAPGDDLLEQSEQLCAYVAKQRLADGSLRLSDGQEARDVDPEAINHYPGRALSALMRSQRYRPAEWKIDVVRKALPFYQAWWRAHRNMAFIPWQTEAYAEAYLLTKEKPFADFVCEMNDWLCEQQVSRLDPRHPMWLGGFMEARDGASRNNPPNIGSAQYAESLCWSACVARVLDDQPRYARYMGAAERCLQFIAALQYTEGNTQHFADWYRPVLLGGFHASHQDGNLRIDYTEQAISALVRYLALTTGG